MANASCNTVTVVNTAMVVSGTVSGTILVGMTLTGAGIPPSVTVVSQSSGTVGQAGNYVVTASAANVTTPEPVVFSLAGIMPFVGNSIMPQIVDMALAAGLATVVFGASIPSPTAAMAAEYRTGSHQEAIYNSQAGGRIFPAAKGIQGRSVVPTILTTPQYPEPIPSVTFKPPQLTLAAPALTQFFAGPQQVDLTQQPIITSPLVPESSGFSLEFHYGTHERDIINSQNQSYIFKAAVTPPVVNQNIVRSFTTLPQELNRDLTIQGWSNVVPVPSGWLLTMITAGPQMVDLTQQAVITQARPFQNVLAPWNPRTIFSTNQADTTQLPAKVFAPPPRAATNRNPTWFFASQQDPTQLAAQVWPRKIAGSSRYVQPTRVSTSQQAYQDVPSVTFKPLTLFVPPPPTPYVQPAMILTQEQFYVNRSFAPSFKQAIFTNIPPPPGFGRGKPGGRVILEPKKQGENIVYIFDFISSLQQGETILTQTVIAEVFSGVDPNPSAIVSGLAAAQGTQVSQRLAQGVLGVIYEVLCIITTNLGNTVEISGYLAIIPDLI